ncbi:MAG: urate hydroxylase PuuD [Vicinamibacteria bacterium]|nr:urate hydroxylase PuuD [Vicinamibacteria bacterium]
MEWSEWASVIMRGAHIFAGILWIGQTWYFAWLDVQFEDAVANPDGKVWMVHSGGFYEVDKIKVPQTMPKTLHWFRWEAMTTWLTGLILLWLVYFAGGLMVDAEGNEMSLASSLGLTIALMVVGWLIYDSLWISPIKRAPLVAGPICYGLMVTLMWYLTQRVAGRPAFLIEAAVLGTIMVMNVWMRILPGQRAMIVDRIAGREPDQSLADRAKDRSKHNTFIILPVIFLMISNHYPITTYGNESNWVVFAVVTLLAWLVVPVLRRR